MAGNVQFRVRRDHILEDAFSVYQLTPNFNPRCKFNIVFVDSNGNVEDGADYGGLFKEFITLLTAQIFDP